MPKGSNQEIFRDIDLDRHLLSLSKSIQDTRTISSPIKNTVLRNGLRLCHTVMDCRNCHYPVGKIAHIKSRHFPGQICTCWGRVRTHCSNTQGNIFSVPTTSSRDTVGILILLVDIGGVRQGEKDLDPALPRVAVGVGAGGPAWKMAGNATKYLRVRGRRGFRMSMGWNHWPSAYLSQGGFL